MKNLVKVHIFQKVMFFKITYQYICDRKWFDLQRLNSIKIFENLVINFY